MDDWIKFKEKNAVFDVDFGDVEFLPTRIVPATADTLGGVMVGDGLSITPEGVLSVTRPILYNTTEYWNSHLGLIAAAGVMYVYSDYREKDGVVYPNFKIGDGTTYLVDLPFGNIDEVVVEEHIADSAIHVSDDDRLRWDNKVTARISESNPEMLILSKT